MRRWRIGIVAFAALVGELGAGVAHAGCTLGKILELPVLMRGRRPMIHGTINGADAVFLLDSGAFYSTLSPGSAAEFKLRTEIIPNFYMSGVGGQTDASRTKMKELGLAGVLLHNIDFIVGGSETGGAGILGQNVLGISDTEYDLGNGVIRLMKSTDCWKNDLAYWAGTKPYSAITIEPTDAGKPHTVGTVMVNGMAMRAIFDTGATETVISPAAAARAGVKTSDSGVRRAGMSRGLGSRMVPVWIATFKDVEIGGETIRNTALQIGDIGGLADMLVGADFFLSHRVYVAKFQHRMYFTYSGGSIFAADPAPFRAVGADGKPLDLAPAPNKDPADAEGFARRAATFATQNDLRKALADLDRAVALDPKNAAYFYDRAQLHRRMGDPADALADLDRALIARPDHPEALLFRARLRLSGVEEEEEEDDDDAPRPPADDRKPAPAHLAEDRAAGTADLDSASRVLAPASDLRFALAGLYERIDRFDEAIGQYDLWIANHPDDSKRPIALNARCWNRALADRDLPKALSDCNAAVRALPQRSTALDSRGLVRLRMGDAKGAIKDYDAALSISPKQAWSLYGRGLAKLKLGDRTGGETDLAAAKALAPKLAARAAGLGIKP